jgi:prevent-host-death family protein
MYILRVTRSYSVADARVHLPDILDQVEAGTEVHLTRRGRPVAVVLSTHRYEALKSDTSSFADAYRAFLTRHSPSDDGLDPDFIDSLRDRKPPRKVRL